jgi:hypothetical protein
MLDEDDDSACKNSRQCVDLTGDAIESPLTLSDNSTIAFIHLEEQIKCTYVRRAFITCEYAKGIFDGLFMSTSGAWTDKTLAPLLYFAVDRLGNRQYFRRDVLLEIFCGDMMEECIEDDDDEVSYRAEADKLRIADMQEEIYDWLSAKDNPDAWPLLFPRDSYYPLEGHIDKSMDLRRVLVFDADCEGCTVTDDCGDFQTAGVQRQRCDESLLDSSVMLLFPWQKAKQYGRAEETFRGGARVYSGKDVPRGAEARWKFLCQQSSALNPLRAKDVASAVSCCTFFARPFADEVAETEAIYAEDLHRAFDWEFPRAKRDFSVDEYKTQLAQWCLKSGFTEPGKPLLERMWCFKEWKLLQNGLDDYISMNALSVGLPMIRDSGVVPPIKSVFLSIDPTFFTQ